MVSSTPTHETRVVELSLHLDREEAQFLADLLGRVGGEPERTRRRFAVAIANELDDHGFNQRTSPFYDEGHDSGTVRDMKDFVFMRRV